MQSRSKDDRRALKNRLELLACELLMRNFVTG
jgi:hypothetical protein